MQGSGLRVLVEGFGVRLRVCGSKVFGMIFFRRRLKSLEFRAPVVERLFSWGGECYPKP